MNLTLKKLCILQIKENGISEKIYNTLNQKENELLDKKEKKYFLKKSERAKIKIGLVGGVFDILHIGHILTLNEAKKYCDILAVIIANDAYIIKKGRKPLHSPEYRCTMVETLKPVDIAILGGKKYETTLARVQPDVIIYGYDQKAFLKPPGVRIVKLRKYIRPEKFKSSKIIKKLEL